MIEAVIGFVGVVIGAIIAGAKDLWADWRFRRKNAQYLAIRIVSILDRYIEGCTEVVSDDGLYHGQPNADGCRQIQVSTPKFDIQSIDVDWKAIPVNLMYDILSFPNFVDAANHRIGDAFEYAADSPDYEEGFEERQYQYAILGLKSSSLADKLRSTYGIPAREYDEWNPIESLTECRKRIEAIRTKRKERDTNILGAFQKEADGS
jgi:hypothetical protein